MRYMIAHNGNGTVHFAAVEEGQAFDSGLPIIEEFDNEAEWIERLKQLGYEDDISEDLQSDQED